MPQQTWLRRFSPAEKTAVHALSAIARFPQRRVACQKQDEPDKISGKPERWTSSRQGSRLSRPAAGRGFPPRATGLLAMPPEIHAVRFLKEKAGAGRHVPARCVREAGRFRPCPLPSERVCVYRFNRFSGQEKGIASMSSLLFRFLPLHVCWLASLGIILAYRSSLTPQPPSSFYSCFSSQAHTGRLPCCANCRPVCCGCFMSRFSSAGDAMRFSSWPPAAEAPGLSRNRPTAVRPSLAPVLVMSLLAFMMEQGAIRIRTVLAAICFHTSCLPVLILATLLIVS